ncbi:MAG: hypothetical protein QOJ26_1668 [Thermoplasmata archaeon]|nr:hypothetical protein [Thermoplasmata archaeon]
MRPSLLWPGMERERLQRWDRWPLALVAALAFAVRWTIRDAHPYTAEAAHYALSLHLWHGVDNLDSVFADVVQDDFSWFFWQRPLLILLYWPAASLGGFAGYRIAHIVVASLVPVLAAVLLRQLGTRPVYTYGAAAVLAVHPVLVPWSVLVLPDTTVLAFTLAGLLAAHAGRPFATAGLLLAGAWVKEIGFVTVAALLVIALWQEADGRRARLWPLRLGPFATLLLPTLALCFLPLFVSMTLPNAALPGFRVGGTTSEAIERLFLLAWLAPVPFLGLLVPPARRLALVALAWPAFFLAYHLATGKAVEVWYNVVPATMVLVASAATLSHLPREGPPVRKWAPAALSAFLALLILVQVVVPGSTALNHAVATPLTRTGMWDLEEALAYERVRDDELFAVMSVAPAGDGRTWLVLDMDYSLVMYPIAERVGLVLKDFTIEGDLSDDGLRFWADAVENRSDATLMAANGVTLNAALRNAYAPCAMTAGLYTSIVPVDCQGYSGRLIEAFRAEQARKFPDKVGGAAAAA